MAIIRLFNGPLVSPTYCLLQLLQEIRYTTFSVVQSVFCLSLTVAPEDDIYLPLVYIRRPLFVFLVQLTIFGICFLPLGYLLLGHLLSGSILNHLMHSKDAECILMFLSAMPRGVSVAHIYVLKTTITSSVNGRKFSIINNNDLD